MTRTLVVRAAAGAEIEQAAGWYERRQPELGEDFVVEIEATFARVLNAPFQFAVLKAGDPSPEAGRPERKRPNARSRTGRKRAFNR